MEDETEAVVSVGIGGLQRERPLQATARLIEPPLNPPHHPEIDQRLGKVRLGRQGAGCQLPRLIDPALIEGDRPLEVQGGGVARRDAQDFAIERRRLGKIARAMAGEAGGEQLLDLGPVRFDHRPLPVNPQPNPCFSTPSGAPPDQLLPVMAGHDDRNAKGDFDQRARLKRKTAATEAAAVFVEPDGSRRSGDRP